MIVTELSQERISEIEKLMELGAPFVTPRTPSDYWMYARLFSSTCLVALINGMMVGAIIAFRSQDDPEDVYVQDVVTHPDLRGRGVARGLLSLLVERVAQRGVTRVYLTSEPSNEAAHRTWLSLGFVNVPGDREEHGVRVTSDFKGPGRDRAVYELRLTSALAGNTASTPAQAGR